jgi:putative transposase
LRSVAAQFQVSVPTVQRWVSRADGQRLDRVDFSDHPSRPKRVHNRTARKLENLILRLRKQLRDKSDLGEFGAVAIHRELTRRGVNQPPSLRAIGYILQRHGAVDYRQRLRRPPPAKGWYLPDAAKELAEIDEFDFVEGLVTSDGKAVEVLNAVSLHGGLVESWPKPRWDAPSALEAILSHWRQFGLPDYAQFDNDNRYTGPHQYADTIGRVIRACLSLGVTPVFAPVSEHGFQNAIESYNGKWQAKVWARYVYKSLAHLQRQSAKHVAAHRLRCRARIEGAPERRKFPRRWQYNEQESFSSGRIIFIRRSSERGVVEVLGHKYEVDRQWASRLVRCEVDIKAKEIRFYALRRRAPDSQPLLRRVKYQLPKRYID